MLKANRENEVNEPSDTKTKIVTIFVDQQTTLMMNKVVTRTLLFKDSKTRNQEVAKANSDKDVSKKLSTER